MVLLLPLNDCLEPPPDACVLRIPVLYGPVEKLEESAVTCLLSVLKSNAPKAVSHHDRRCPAHTKDIALILADMIALMGKVSMPILVLIVTLKYGRKLIATKKKYIYRCKPVNMS